MLSSVSNNSTIISTGGNSTGIKANSTSMPTCQAGCDSGFFLNNGKCTKCSANVNTCYSSVVALSCMQSFFLSNQTCVANCPNAFYANKVNLNCDACDNSCATCNGPTSSNCTSCAAKLMSTVDGKSCVA